MFKQGFTCPALLKDMTIIYPYGAVTRYGPTFQTVPLEHEELKGCSPFARHYLGNLG